MQHRNEKTAKSPTQHRTGASRMARTRGIAIAIALVSLIAPHSAHAQLTQVEEKGFPLDGSFSGGDIDTVNLQNGNLHISIPIASAIAAIAPRRGTHSGL
jgi:hypothetical protein